MWMLTQWNWHVDTKVEVVALTLMHWYWHSHWCVVITTLILLCCIMTHLNWWVDVNIDIDMLMFSSWCWDVNIEVVMPWWFKTLTCRPKTCSYCIEKDNTVKSEMGKRQNRDTGVPISDIEVAWSVSENRTKKSWDKKLGPFGLIRL